MDLREFEEFRDACKGFRDDFDVVKIKLCYDFGWTEKQVNEQSIDWILKCIIYIEEMKRREKRQAKNLKKKSHGKRN